MHGNSLKKEKCPDGSKDENVFDIQQGVAIALFVKRRDKTVGQAFLPDSQKYNEGTDRNVCSTDTIKITPEVIFYYIYAVLYSNTYRTKYAEFLKIDFPRVPFTKDYEAFSKMGEYGKRLVDLHLLKSEELDPPVAKFQGKGDDKVEKVRYDEGRIYINKDQYFEGVKPEVWEYQIGGYQVCDKWLKDRKGRRLSLDDIWKSRL